MATVIASGLTKRFETTCAVDGVDLVVGEGEVRGLLGPNGAGKTTLLRMLLGLVRPDGGTIELFGRTLREADTLVLDGVSGFVEDPSFYPYLSGRANLELLAELDGGGSRARIDDVLQQVKLAGRGSDRVSGYSSGMRQRLGIAAALLRAPRLLLLDEPTAGLDPAGVRFVGGLVRGLSASGVAVLLSSHQIGEIEEVCDSFSVLSRGRMVWEGTAEQMRVQAPPSAYRMLTSDDPRALEIARGQRGVQAELSPIGGLTVKVEGRALDPFVLALGRSDVAIRRLELTMSSLESMFFALTDRSQEDPIVVPELAHKNVSPQP
ncbi:MAG: ABC transporter ATP-binding protein [Solirubrobacteraceae bacterium]|jgi:ABC-2 type transport system ATP-binding protein